MAVGITAPELKQLQGPVETAGLFDSHFRLIVTKRYLSEWRHMILLSYRTGFPIGIQAETILVACARS